jgi:dihydroorotate dehydrogenase
MWYQAIRPALFALDPEHAHRMVLTSLRLTGRHLPRRTPGRAVECMGLRFLNRVGLAAGFDKDAVAVDALGRLGFGFIEIGTVTPRPQPGQPRPRLFRLPAAGALINRLGFPNEGAKAVAARLRRGRYPGVVGVNIGKNAATPLSRAIDDYVSCFRTLRNVADYIVVNVSSPNTEGLRTLQALEHLEPLLSALMDERSRAGSAGERKLPLLVKISPDLSTDALQTVATLLKTLPLDGVVATNTTVSRDGALPQSTQQTGGLSGMPLRPIAINVVKELRACLGADFPIIGVGGIDSPEAALAMRDAGANLVQLYTGLVYRGPALITQCVRALQ